MRQKSTFVALFFLATTLLVAWVVHLAVQTGLGAFRIGDSPILGDRVLASHVVGAVFGLAAGLGGFLHPRTNRLIGEVLDELNKVNWPAWAETKVNTLVVIVTSVVAALILGLFDMTFGWASDLLAELRL